MVVVVVIPLKNKYDLSEKIVGPWVPGHRGAQRLPRLGLAWSFLGVRIASVTSSLLSRPSQREGKKAHF